MLDRIAGLVGVDPGSPLLAQALTHPSYSNEVAAAPHYQRLEFLGDAVLGLCAAELLYGRYPGADEGTLSRHRAQLVNTEALAAWGRGALLGDALRLGRGADSAAFRQGSSVLSDAVEALVAVAYLERGLEGARRFCQILLEPALDALEEGGALDPKSALQELVQDRGGATPRYEVRDSGGPSHDPWFLVSVQIDGRSAAEGRGRSKRLAERAAAAAALLEIGRDASKTPPESPP